MKIFLTSLVAYAVIIAVAGYAYTSISATASETYSLDSARVGHDNDVSGRLGWEAEDY